MSYTKTLKMWTYVRGSFRKYQQGTEEVKWEKGQKPGRGHYQATMDNWSLCPSHQLLVAIEYVKCG